MTISAHHVVTGWRRRGGERFVRAVAAHIVRDIGAFQIGLGAVLLLALVVRDALPAALAGVGAGAVAHALSPHVLDRDLGG